MPLSFSVLLAVALGQPLAIQTEFVQVHPAAKIPFARSAGQDRAILLIHGIRLHPVHSAKVHVPELHDWQKSDSTLVKSLAKEGDVFAFAYGQNAKLDTIAQTPGLGNAVAKLQFLGYREVVLVGHSAGGVLARLFVEDHPDAAVTRVIQVCAPNDGSSMANANFAVCKEQEEFLHSLTKKARRAACVQRVDKKIPDKVQFVCVVGSIGAYGDGMVACHCQWPTDLQKQGIPAVRVLTSHMAVMRGPITIERLTELVRTDQPRWTPEHVERVRKSILEVGERGVSTPR